MMLDGGMVRSDGCIETHQCKKCNFSKQTYLSKNRVPFQLALHVLFRVPATADHILLPLQLGGSHLASLDELLLAGLELEAGWTWSSYYFDQMMLGLEMRWCIILVKIGLLQVQRHGHVVSGFPLFMQPLRDLKFGVLLALT